MITNVGLSLPLKFGQHPTRSETFTLIELEHKKLLQYFLFTCKSLHNDLQNSNTRMNSVYIVFYTLIVQHHCSTPYSKYGFSYIISNRQFSDNPVIFIPFRKMSVLAFLSSISILLQSDYLTNDVLQYSNYNISILKKKKPAIFKATNGEKEKKGATSQNYDQAPKKQQKRTTVIAYLLLWTEIHERGIMEEIWNPRSIYISIPAG